MSEWKEYSFMDLLSNIVDNRGKTCPVVDNGMPLIATNCITNDTLYPVYEKVRYVDEETYQNWFRGHPKPGDMIFVCKGSPGRVNWTPDPVPFCIAQDMVAIRAKEEIVDSKYLFALLRSNEVQAKIANMHVGSLIPHFKKGDFSNLYLKIITDKDKQIKIGNLYFKLSEKIENNRRMNETLEGMAQAIFKSWFVDFDPVRAKVDALESGCSDDDARLAALQAISGKSPEDLARLKTENPESYAELAATADSFPSAFTTSPLGDIPVGWEVKGLDQIANYLNGLALQKFRPKDESYFLPVLKIAQLKKGATDGAEKASPDIKPEYIVDNGDIVFSWSGSLVVDVWCGGKAALNQHLFKVTSDEYPKWLYYLYTRHHLQEFQRIAADKAVTMGHIKREHLSQALCAVPKLDSELMDICGRTLQNNLSKQIELRLECTSLAETRDALLPKLLSGEIDISNLGDE